MTGRLHLPEGYSTYSQPSSKVRKEKVGCQPIIMEEELGSTESDSESDEEEKETKSRSDDANRGQKKETPEEKKARKAEVKKERRENRAAKRALKMSFTNEGKTIMKKSANQQSINNVSVFKYSM